MPIVRRWIKVVTLKVVTAEYYSFANFVLNNTKLLNGILLCVSALEAHICVVYIVLVNGFRHPRWYTVVCQMFFALLWCRLCDF